MFNLYKPDLLHLNGAERERKTDLSMNLEKTTDLVLLSAFYYNEPILKTCFQAAIKKLHFCSGLFTYG